MNDWPSGSGLMTASCSGNRQPAEHHAGQQDETRARHGTPPLGEHRREAASGSGERGTPDAGPCRRRRHDPVRRFRKREQGSPPTLLLADRVARVVHPAVSPWNGPTKFAHPAQSSRVLTISISRMTRTSARPTVAHGRPAFILPAPDLDQIGLLAEKRVAAGVGTGIVRFYGTGDTWPPFVQAAGFAALIPRVIYPRDSLRSSHGLGS